MTRENPDNLYKIEDLMREAAEADQAGVFRSTPVEATALMTMLRSASGSAGLTGADLADSGRTDVLPGTPARRLRWMAVAKIVVPLAACVAVFVGVARLTPTTEPLIMVDNGGTPPSTSSMLAGGNDSGWIDFGQFDRCFTGPAIGALGGECAHVDFDSDGDVDFADFGVLQRQLASARG